jgi:radical SAM protein with 4Fe4S-binding SPASM domain
MHLSELEERPNPREVFLDNRSKRFVFRTFFDTAILYDRKTGKIINAPTEIDETELFVPPTCESIAPLKVYYDPSYKCNLSCRHCLTSSSPSVDTSGELPLGRILKLVEEVAFSGAVEIGIGGGEPLLYPHIYDILAAAQDLGVNTVLTTNGIPLTPEIVKRLSEFDLYEMRVSFEGYQSIHDDIRGPGRYRQALDAIALLVEKNMRVKARLTLTRRATRELQKLFRDLSSRGVKDIKVTVVKAFGRASQNTDLLVDSVNLETAYHLMDMGRKYALNVELSSDDFPLSIEQARNKKPRSGKCRNCGAGLETVYISPSGEVYPCTSMMYYSLGYLDTAYMDVLNSEAARTYRKLALEYSDTRQERHICRNLSFLNNLNPGSPSHPRARLNEL